MENTPVACVLSIDDGISARGDNATPKACAYHNTRVVVSTWSTDKKSRCFNVRMLTDLNK